jgi:hypothetical protein
MSNCISSQSCGSVISIDDLIKNIVVKDTNGCHYVKINTTTINAEDCADYEPAVSCGSFVTAQDVLKLAITLDDCNNPVLNVLVVANG